MPCFLMEFNVKCNLTGMIEKLTRMRNIGKIAE